MPKKTTLAIITSDARFLARCKRELRDGFEIKSYLLKSRSGNCRRSLRSAIQKIIGLSDGNITAQVVITDGIFCDKDHEPYFIADALFESLPFESGSCLSTLLGAGIPVIVNPRTKDPFRLWQLGASGAEYFVSGKLNENKTPACLT